MGQKNDRINPIEKPMIKDDGIDLIVVAKTIWAGRKTILIVTTAFFLFGLLIAFGSKVEYKASCKLMPESQEEGMRSNLGGLGGLAGLAGINLDMGSNSTLSPDLYPQIAKSYPLLIRFVNEPIYFNKLSSKYTLLEYYVDHYKPSLIEYLIKYSIGLPKFIFGFINYKTNPKLTSLVLSDSTGILTLNSHYENIIQRCAESIKLDIDNKNGVITLTVELDDNYAAAELTNIIVRELTLEITNYKLQKVKSNLQFMKGRYTEAELKYEHAQIKLASFMDKNLNINSSGVRVQLQKLQNESNLRFEVYKGLATQLEQAKIKIKEETPVFKIIEPARVPLYKSKPQRILLILSLTILGVLTSLIIITIRTVFPKIKSIFSEP